MKRNLKLLWALTFRHLRMFFKNKVTFFFSLLVPIITLAIYLLFLRELEVSSVSSIITGYGLSDPTSLIDKAYNLIDSWMLSGILAVSCISVSLNACSIIISDREKGVNREFVASPVSKSLVTLSYFVFNILVTMIICTGVLFVCLAYLGIVGNFYLSLVNFGYIYLVMFLSIVSAATVTIFLCSFIHGFSVFNSLIAIISAAVGFLIGGYMPISMLPTGAQNLTAFFPGTYSAALFRNYFMSDQIAELTDFMMANDEYALIADELLSSLTENFSLDLTVFGGTVTVGHMYIVLIVSIFLFALIDILLSNRNFRIADMGSRRKAKKKALEKQE